MRGLEVWVDVGGKSPCHGSQQDIASEVQEPASSISDEEFGRNGSPNFLQGPLDFDERQIFFIERRRPAYQGMGVYAGSASSLYFSTWVLEPMLERSV